MLEMYGLLFVILQDCKKRSSAFIGRTLDGDLAPIH